MDLFALTMSPWELVLRGSVIYVGLILVIRFILRRDVGSLGAPDVLFIVLVADAAQNAMAGEYKSIADGAVLLATLVLWNMALDGLAYHVPLIRRIVEPPALPLVLDGRPLRQNLRREWITLEELQAKLREHGIENMASVKRATLEPDGELSVLEADGKAEGPVRRRRPAA